MKTIAAILFLIIAALPSARAQAPQSQFTPLTLQKADYDQLMTTLLEWPYKYSAGVIQWFGQKEREAQIAEMQKAAEAKKAAATFAGAKAGGNIAKVPPPKK